MSPALNVRVYAIAQTSQELGERKLFDIAGLENAAFGIDPTQCLDIERGWTELAADRPLTASAGIGWRIGRLNLSADVLAGSGAVRTADRSDPNGARASACADFGLAAVYHWDLFGRPLDVRLDLTDLTNVHCVTSDAANLEGGWTHYATGRSLLVGFEQSF